MYSIPTIIIIVLICVSIYFFKKKLLLPAISFCVISAMMFSVMITNWATAIRKVDPTDEQLEFIANIDWSDEQQLTNLGFEKDGDSFAWYAESGDIIGAIYVEPCKEIPKKLKKHKDVYYKGEEKGLGILEIKRLWLKEKYVYRNFYFYTDGVEISSREDSAEDLPNVIDYLIKNADTN